MTRLLPMAAVCLTTTICGGCGGQVSSEPPRSSAAAIEPASSSDPVIAPNDVVAMAPANSTVAQSQGYIAPAADISSPAGAAATREITFDTIKFAMNKEDPFLRSMLTPQIEQMEGTPIRVRGWIHPNSVFQQSGITQFVLVRDNQECCFGPGAALYDCIMVEMKPGRTTEFTTRPIAVEGTFKIREVKAPWGAIVAIYHLDGESAK